MKWAKAMAMAAPLLLGTGAAITTTSLVFVVGSTPAVAAEKGQKLSAKVGKPLQAAQELAQKKQFKEAMAKVKEAQAVSGKTPYEEKVVNEFTAYVAMNLRDYPTAIKAYESTLSSPLLTKEELPQRLQTLIQLNYQIKNYKKVDELSRRYLKDVGYDNDVALLLAQSQYLQGNYAGAEQAIGDVIKRNPNPKEEWLKLRMSSLHQLQRRDEVVKTLEELLKRYPSKSYWSDMFAYLQSSGNRTDRSNLEVYRLKRQTAGLEADEYLEMAELALALGVPGDALNLLEEGFSKGLLGKTSGGRDQRLLNLAKTQAKEDQASLAALSKEAGAAANGEASVKLGEAYLSYGQYQQAQDAIKAGLAKGNVKTKDEALLHQGIALLKMNKAQDAVKVFNSVPASSPLGQVARLWALYASNPQAIAKG